jgi:hypothetical protein
LLQALESFLLRCPRDISVYCDEILHLALTYLSYDPNFTDNMEEDTDDEGHEEEDDEYVSMCLFDSVGYLYGIYICTIFFLLIISYIKYYFPERVQMNIQMMKMPAGKCAEQQLNA